MVLTEFKEALDLIRRTPVLWVQGLVTGSLAAMLWLIYNLQDSFFATRLILICSLMGVFFLTGSYAVIRKETGGFRELLTGGVQYFFRVLLPLLVIIFCVLILVALVMITLSFGGEPADPEFVGVFSLCILIPVGFLTIFFDVAAVFEDRRVFDAMRRSIELVAVQSVRVFKFYVVSAAFIFVVTFSLMMVWEAALYDKLEPLTNFNETQIAAFTPDQLVGMIGSEGTVVTAICLFFGFLVLLPILSTYKACFFRSLTRGSPGSPGSQGTQGIQGSQGPIPVNKPETGEYDSKGRWYKY
ncbi:MAG: hypothetical protein CVV34_01905 [Methanomicrobiales archaeon HGW-Methanomicrobiales-5]|nr:MAG: hypothetical protein CVV34_01905 [Methanomicrobiales archaeon HGW-Methanomicrobiales-5]